MDSYPAYVFFALFRGKELIVVPCEDDPRQILWDFARGLVSGQPRCEEVERILKSRFFREIVVEEVKRIECADHIVFACRVSSQTRGIVEQTYVIRRSNIDFLPPLSDRLYSLLSSPEIKNRLM